MARDGTCYILGAGFSHSAGLPLASELTEAVIRHYWRADLMDQSVSPVIVDRADFGGEEWIEDRHFLRMLFAPFDFETTWPDFELMLTVLDDAAAWMESLGVSGLDNTARRVRKELINALASFIAMRVTVVEDARLEPIMRFLRKLDPTRDTIISFNWDTLVEIAARARGTAISLGDGQPGVPLIKPHGSIDLAELTESEWNEAQTSSNVHSLSVVSEYTSGATRWKVLRADDPREAEARVVGPLGASSLVAPSLRKEYRSPYIQTTWARALKTIRLATEICIIGFSFPESDIRPRTLLRLAMDRRGPPPRVRIVDSNPRPRSEDFCREIGFLDLVLDPQRWEVTV